MRPFGRILPPWRMEWLSGEKAARGAKVKRSKTLLVGLELEWVRVDDRWLFKVESKENVDRNEDIGNGRRVGESC